MLINTDKSTQATSESKALLDHIDSCPDCRKEYDSCLRSIHALSLLDISSMGEEIPETGYSGFWAGLEESVQGRIARSAPRGIPWIWFGAGFAAAACLLLAFWLAVPSSSGGGVSTGVGVSPSPVAGGPSRGNLVPVTGPLGGFNPPGTETQGGAVPVKWFQPTRPRERRGKGKGPAEAVPVGYRARF